MIRTLSQRVAVRLPFSVQQRQLLLYWLVLLIPLPLAVYTIGLGRYPIAPGEVIDALVRFVADPPEAGAQPDLVYNVVTRIRLPRITAALLIGANLAVTGVAFQGDRKSVV